MMKDCLLFYTNNILPEQVLIKTLNNAIRSAENIGAELIITSHYPVASWAKNVSEEYGEVDGRYDGAIARGDFIKKRDFVKCYTVGPQPQELRSIVKQIVFSIKESCAENFYMHEHDVFYPQNYFKYMSRGLEDHEIVVSLSYKFVDIEGYFSTGSMNNFALSRFAGKRDVLLEIYEERLIKDFTIIEPLLSGHMAEDCSRVIENYKIFEGFDPVIEMRHGVNSSGDLLIDERNSYNYYWGEHTVFSDLIDDDYKKFVEKNPNSAYGIINL